MRELVGVKEAEEKGPLSTEAVIQAGLLQRGAPPPSEINPPK